MNVFITAILLFFGAYAQDPTQDPQDPQDPTQDPQNPTDIENPNQLKVWKQRWAWSIVAHVCVYVVLVWLFQGSPDWTLEGGYAWREFGMVLVLSGLSLGCA